jgi:hypothetical protein
MNLAACETVQQYAAVIAEANRKARTVISMSRASRRPLAVLALADGLQAA